MNLKDWVLNYVKSRAAFDGDDFSIEESGNSISLKKDSGNKLFLVSDFLDDSLLKVIEDHAGSLTVVAALSKIDNVNWLVKNWDFLIKFDKLSFMFINLDTSEKWAVFPKSHDLVTERSVLKKGLLSLFEGI